MTTQESSKLWNQFIAVYYFLVEIWRKEYKGHTPEIAVANGINPNRLNHFLFLGSEKNRLNRVTARTARIARPTFPIFFTFTPSFEIMKDKIIFALIITKKGTFLHEIYF